MWNYPQMYYFGSAQIFELYQSKSSKRKIRKDSQQLFSYEFNAPDVLTTDPTQDESWVEEIFIAHGQSLGQVMVSTGLALLVPEGTELFLPITLLDEVIGFTLIVGGIIFQLVY